MPCSAEIFWAHLFPSNKPFYLSGPLKLGDQSSFNSTMDLNIATKQAHRLRLVSDDGDLFPLRLLA